MRTTSVAFAFAAVGLVCWQGAGAFPVEAPTVKQAATTVSNVKQIKVGAGAAADSRTAVRPQTSYGDGGLERKCATQNPRSTIRTQRLAANFAKLPDSLDGLQGRGGKGAPEDQKRPSLPRRSDEWII
jgi:hypothetical protein